MSEAPKLEVVADDAKPETVRLDRVTLAHAAIGGVLGVAGAPWWIALTAGAGAQVVSFALERGRPKPTAEQITNKVIDVGAMLAAWAVARSIRGRAVNIAAAASAIEDGEEMEPSEDE